MNDKIRETWENYVLSWKAISATEKKQLFEKCLDISVQYNDPSIKLQGQDELLNYMLEFHNNVPGGQFVTTDFNTHSNKSVAQWDMKDGNNVIQGNGISYCEYNANGMLTSMTGFFDSPES